MNAKTIFDNLTVTFVGYCDANITTANASAADFLTNLRSKSRNAALVASSPIEWFSLLFQPDLALCRANC
jgi:hypothetical protein